MKELKGKEFVGRVLRKNSKLINKKNEWEKQPTDERGGIVQVKKILVSVKWLVKWLVTSKTFLVWRKLRPALSFLQTWGGSPWEGAC